MRANRIHSTAHSLNMHSESNPYEQNLAKNAANCVPLSPLSFLERSAMVYPQRASVVYHDTRYTWAQTYARCRQLASSLVRLGIRRQDTVSVIAPNIPALYEMHFAVPMTGGVLNTINTRLDANTIAFILNHANTKVLFVDTDFAAVAASALEIVSHDMLIVYIHDDAVQYILPNGALEYETLIAQGDTEFRWAQPDDEWDAISLNYTSGTTGNPKGVVYHYRGAYLNSLSNALNWNISEFPIYLWTLPMFHCNGWCFPWTLAMLGGTSICLRKVDAASIFHAIEKYQVTHFCGAPIILGMIINATASEQRSFNHTIEVMTAAAPPPSAVLERMEKAGFNMTHVYGLTETYGPAVICEWKNDWNRMSDSERAQYKSRQGVPYAVLEDLEVLDSNDLSRVPADSASLGEVMFRGNNVMKGYLKNPEATQKAFAGGWFRSGDLGVMHADRYIQLKDRSKDIIISGGENISSIEVEDALFSHPAVAEAAVVAKRDKKWGEMPCAFVKLNPDYQPQPTQQDLIEHCKNTIARFKAPKEVVFGELPKTSTGKIQKYLLRKRANALPAHFQK